jgi:hypothetical protein
MRTDNINGLVKPDEDGKGLAVTHALKCQSITDAFEVGVNLTDAFEVGVKHNLTCVDEVSAGCQKGRGDRANRRS